MTQPSEAVMSVEKSVQMKEDERTPTFVSQQDLLASENVQLKVMNVQLEIRTLQMQLEAAVARRDQLMGALDQERQRIEKAYGIDLVRTHEIMPGTGQIRLRQR